MKVMLSICSLAGANGGPTRSTSGLAKALAGAGAEVTLVSHDGTRDASELIADLREHGVEYLAGEGVGFLASLRFAKRLLAERHPEVIHIQGLWTFDTHAMSVAAKRAGIPIVVSPRGMLAPWALDVKKWKKRLGLLLYERGDLRRATAFHATVAEEAADIAAFGLRQPVITVPNGVALPAPSSRAGGDRVRTALFLSRLHPEKGLKLIAEAWGRMHPQGWRMVVVGPDVRGHRAEVEARLAELGVAADWEFVGEVKDDGKWEYLRGADLFIHPSKGENFGISIAEALATGVPVITTKGCPWAMIDGRAGWWIDRDVEMLAATMKSAMSLADSERFALGSAGRKLIESDFAWPAIASRMLAGYARVIG